MSVNLTNQSYNSVRECRCQPQRPATVKLSEAGKRILEAMLESEVFRPLSLRHP